MPDENIQGNLITPFRRTHKSAAFLFLQFKDARGAVRAVRQHITSEAQPLTKASAARVLGLSFNGYRKLGVTPPNGLRSMADPSYPFYWVRNRATWPQHFRDGVDAVLLVTHDDEAGLDGAITATRDWLSGFAAVEAEQYQPNEKLEPPLNPEFGGRKPGHFANPKTVLDVDEGAHASFLKIEVKFTELDGHVAALAAPGNDVAQATAMIFGRKPDGSPPGGITAGRSKDPAASRNPNASKDPDEFTLEGASQLQCPFQAHAAVMRPRGRANSFGKIQAPNQIVRRSWTYDQGLLFFSYQKDPLDFAVLMNRGQNFRDPILAMGTDPDGTSWPAQNWVKPDGSQVESKISDLTTIRGGENFYFPSIKALEDL